MEGRGLCERGIFLKGLCKGASVKGISAKGWSVLKGVSVKVGLNKRGFCVKGGSL